VDKKREEDELEERMNNLLEQASRLTNEALPENMSKSEVKRLVGSKDVNLEPVPGKPENNF
jgi:hypothetical protein